MAFTNNVMIVRHKLLENLVALWKENQLVEKIDRIPLEISPRRSQPVGRCCIHKERAVTKYKLLPLLGWDMTDETDELTPLSEYARKTLERKERIKENILCVIDEACSSCVQVNYEVSNLCRGCVARSCYMNCPKGAVHTRRLVRHRLTTTSVSVAVSATKAVRITPSSTFRCLVRKLVR